MWVILLSLFVFAEGTTGEIKCDKYRHEQCPYPKLFRQIPREVDVFNALCPDILTFIKCAEEYDMKCEENKHRRFAGPEKYANIFSVFDEICEEGSTLNEVVTSNLKCLNDTFSNTNCRLDMVAFIESYQEEVPLDEFTTSITYVIPERVHCLSELHFLGCIVEDISRNCGIRARHGTVEFLQRTSYADGACPLEFRENLLEDIDEFDLTEEQRTFAIAELERMKISDDS